VSSPVSATVLAGDIAYVTLSSFVPDAGTQVLAAIGDLHLGSRLRGIVLDLRSGGGGAPAGVSQLLGAFAHGKIWGYNVDGNGTCAARILDWVCHLHFCRHDGRRGSWLAGCCSRSSTC
jgi:C-terminal processing protease CtpA/Prc